MAKRAPSKKQRTSRDVLVEIMNGQEHKPQALKDKQARLLAILAARKKPSSS